MMTAEARSKAREELFMVPYPFNTGSERRQSSNLIRYGWARGYSARKIVKRLLRYAKACAAKMTSLLMASTVKRGEHIDAHACPSVGPASKRSVVTMSSDAGRRR